MSVSAISTNMIALSVYLMNCNLINKKKRKIRYPEAFERKTPSYSPIGMRRFYTRQLPDTGVLKIRIPYRPVAGYRPLRISAFKDYPQIIFNPPSGMAVLPV
jgi:hypothetical protein